MLRTERPRTTWAQRSSPEPIVKPTALVVFLGGNVYLCWVFATAHIIGMSVCFWFRFRGGKWKSMRVIEPGVAEEEKKS